MITKIKKILIVLILIAISASVVGFIFIKNYKLIKEEKMKNVQENSATVQTGTIKEDNNLNEEIPVGQNENTQQNEMAVVDNWKSIRSRLNAVAEKNKVNIAYIAYVSGEKHLFVNGADKGKDNVVDGNLCIDPDAKCNFDKNGNFFFKDNYNGGNIIFNGKDIGSGYSDLDKDGNFVFLERKTDNNRVDHFIYNSKEIFSDAEKNYTNDTRVIFFDGQRFCFRVDTKNERGDYSYRFIVDGKEVGSSESLGEMGAFFTCSKNHYMFDGGTNQDNFTVLDGKRIDSNLGRNSTNFALSDDHYLFNICEGKKCQVVFDGKKVWNKPGSNFIIDGDNFAFTFESNDKIDNYGNYVEHVNLNGKDLGAIVMPSWPYESPIALNNGHLAFVRYPDRHLIFDGRDVGIISEDFHSALKACGNHIVFKNKNEEVVSDNKRKMLGDNEDGTYFCSENDILYSGDIRDEADNISVSGHIFLNNKDLGSGRILYISPK